MTERKKLGTSDLIKTKIANFHSWKGTIRKTIVKPSTQLQKKIAICVSDKRPVSRTDKEKPSNRFEETLQKGTYRNSWRAQKQVLGRISHPASASQSHNEKPPHTHQDNPSANGSAGQADAVGQPELSHTLVGMWNGTTAVESSWAVS